MDASAVGGHDPGFAEHLTSEDLRLLRSAAGGMHDRGIEALLGEARVFDAVFGRPAAGFITVSPFLAFTVAVHRAAADLTVAGYLPERSGLRQRVPLFAALQLRDFLSSADRHLFLAGVFPGYSAAGALGPDTERLLRLARVPAPDRGSMAAAPAIDLLEYLGARWYRAAVALAPVRTARLTAVGEVAERFRHARRILDHLADQYLLGPDSPWFTAPG